MPKFFVTVFRTVTENAGVEVEAYGPEMAEALAIQKVEGDSSKFRWRSYDYELEATDVEELEENKQPPSAA